VKLICWNIQHAKLDDEGWLTDDINGIAARESPDVLVLMEAQRGLREVLADNPPAGYYVPQEPAGSQGSGYAYTSTLRYVALAKTGPIYRHLLVGSAFRQVTSRATGKPVRLARRPGLSIRWNSWSFVAPHAPAVTGRVRPQADSVLASMAGAIAAWTDQRPVDLVFGDLNVDQANPGRLQSFMNLVAPQTQGNYPVLSPAQATHFNKNQRIWDATLDWGFYRNGSFRGVPQARVVRASSNDRMQLQPFWPGNKRGREDDDEEDFQLPYTGVKGSDHKPVCFEIPE
jgi:hypothetical protein